MVSLFKSLQSCLYTTLKATHADKGYIICKELEICDLIWLASFITVEVVTVLQCQLGLLHISKI